MRALSLVNLEGCIWLLRRNQVDYILFISISKTNNSMIKSVILHLDMFAPHFEFYVNKDQTRFQSIFGGVFTLIIGILTLIYAIVNINMWATNGR
jgi:hypothetical protein